MYGVMAVTNINIMKKLEEIAVDTDARLATMEQSLKKLNEAVYGNGGPGLKEKQREHEKRIGEIEARGSEPAREVAKALADRLAVLEQTHAVCPIVRINKAVTEIEKRHSEEDEIIQDEIEDREQEEDSARKFRWETLAVAAAPVLNLIFTLIQSFLIRRAALAALMSPSRKGPPGGLAALYAHCLPRALITNDLIGARDGGGVSGVGPARRRKIQPDFGSPVG
jgi:hypothetical protein